MIRTKIQFSPRAFLKKISFEYLLIIIDRQAHSQRSTLRCLQMIRIDRGLHDENDGSIRTIIIRKLRMQDLEDLFSKTIPCNKKLGGLLLLFNKNKVIGLYTTADIRVYFTCLHVLKVRVNQRLHRQGGRYEGPGRTSLPVKWKNNKICY